MEIQEEWLYLHFLKNIRATAVSDSSLLFILYNYYVYWQLECYHGVPPNTGMLSNLFYDSMGIDDTPAFFNTRPADSSAANKQS